MRSNNFIIRKKQNSKKSAGISQVKKNAFGHRILLIGLLTGLMLSLNAYGQSSQRTEGSADQSLRSSGRVNPSSLGMEMDIPLGSYPGRGINVPISLSYSSKVWRMKPLGLVDGGIVSGGCRSLSEATYGENSASGWTTSLAVPYIEYTGKDNLYYTNGFPISEVLCVNAPPEINNDAAYIRRISIHLPSGETHELRADDTPAVYDRSSTCPPANGYVCDPNSYFLQANWDRTFYATDGSNIKYLEDSTTGTYRLLMPDGSYYDFEPAISYVNEATARKAVKFTDRNGNFTSYNLGTGVWTDTLGRSLPAPIGTSAPSAPTPANAPLEYSMAGMTGKYKFHWKQLKGTSAAESGLTNFNQDLKYRGDKIAMGNNGNWTVRPDGTFLFHSTFDSYVKSGSDPFNPIVLTKIELPTGQSYTFSYDIYGQIEDIKYPTGGEEKFVYTAVAPLSLSYSDDVSKQTNFGVTNRKVYQTDGQGTPYQWNYSADYVEPAGYKISVTSPDGTMNQRLLHRGNDSFPNSSVGNFGYDNGLAGMPYEELSFSNTGQIVSRKLTHWTKKSFAVPEGNQTADWHPRVDYDESIVYDTATGDGVSATTKYEFEGDLNQRETPVLVNKTLQYAFVAKTSVGNSPISPPDPDDPPDPHPTPVPTPVPPTLVKIVEIDYQNDVSYTNKHIIGLTKEVRVLNPNNQSDVLSKNQVIYDEATYPIIDYGAATGYQAPTGGAANLRGNATTNRTWVKETNTWIETHAQYDNFGHTRKVWDSSGDATRFIETEYAAQYMYAYPTKITTPAPDPTGAHGTTESSTVSTTYDLTTGLALSVTDATGQTTSVEYDGLLRAKRIVPPAGGTITEKEYGEIPGSLYVKVRQQIDEQNWAESTSFMDGLGRVYKTQKKDLQGDIFTEVEYDTAGKIKRVSSPYRQGEQKFWTKSRYDTAGRVVEGYAPAPDGQTGASLGTVEFGISTIPGLVGPYITGTDASGRKVRSITNHWGQVIRMDEPTGNNDLGSLSSPNQPSYYSYNVKGELTKIQQGQQNRYFMYDSLSRLIRVRQPEQSANPSLNTTGNPENNQWSAGFAYDNFGNVTSVADTRGTVITNSYDNAGRIKTSSYSDNLTPQVDYYYDGKGLPQVPQYAKGHLTKIANSVSETRYTSFDSYGRTLASQQITDGQIYDFDYKYNMSGDLIEETYPSRRVVKTHLDADGGLTAVSSKTATGNYKTYASNFEYTATGDVKAMMLGNGRWETAAYNERYQLTQIGLGTAKTDTSLWKVNYEYGELNTDGTTVDTAKNIGNIAKQTITVPTTNFVQTYKYDELNRLTAAKETTGGTQNWQQTFGYDRFGNRTGLSQTIGNAPLAINSVTLPAIDPATNRFTTGQGYVYDLNGNLIQNAENKGFTYNGDDKQTEVRDLNIAVSPSNPDANLIGRYFYDGDGQRVKKVTNTETTVFVYDGGGDLVAEYSTAAPPPSPTTSYLTSDHLGSPRIVTDKLGDVTSRRDFMPFGEELGAGVGARSTGLKYSAATDKVRQRFTGYEQDDESQLDFAQARMYQNKHGRFTAVDPLLSSASLSNPQTFNRYAYTGNNPVNFTDPSGLRWLQENGTNNFIYLDDSKDYDKTKFTDVTGQIVLLISAPSGSDNSQYVGSFVRLDSHTETMTQIAENNVTPAESTQIAEQTGANVQATYDEIISSTAGTLGRTLVSAITTAAEDNGFYTLPVQHNTGGRVIGHLLAGGQAITEIAFGSGLITAGLGGEFGSVIVGLTGAGAIIAIPGAVVSTAAIGTGAVIAGHGVFVSANTIINIYNQVNHHDNFDNARRDAFNKAGMDNPDDVEFNKVDPETGTIVDFKGKNGGKVNYDSPHADMNPKAGHDKPHVGWQTPGKRGQKGFAKGNNTYDGPQHPYRSDKK